MPVDGAFRSATWAPGQSGSGGLGEGRFAAPGMQESAPRGGSATVRDLASKLRITAAALGCSSQKDLCARFREVNPGTTFDLERSYKWMQGRAQPRSSQIYVDWATLLRIDRPISYLQSCTADEFLDLVCKIHGAERSGVAARAGVKPEARSGADGSSSAEALRARYLTGAYACYSHAWSPYFQGKLIRGALVIEMPARNSGGLRAKYTEDVPVGVLELSGPVALANRSVHIDLVDPSAGFRLTMSLFLPGTLASVLVGVLSGVTIVDAHPQPAATRILMVRVPTAGLARLEISNRYLDATDGALSRDLIALGVPVSAPEELEALLEAFLSADVDNRYINVTAAEYATLTLAIDRLFIADAVLRSPPASLVAAAAGAGAEPERAPGGDEAAETQGREGAAPGDGIAGALGEIEDAPEHRGRDRPGAKAQERAQRQGRAEVRGRSGFGERGREHRRIADGGEAVDEAQ
jgi:hypothetical protein